MIWLDWYFQIEEYDELPKVICASCQNRLEMVRSFFETCFAANHQLVLDHRSRRPEPHPLEFQDHVNHYLRSFQPAYLSQNVDYVSIWRIDTPFSSPVWSEMTYAGAALHYRCHCIGRGPCTTHHPYYLAVAKLGFPSVNTP